ncbi:hypothetical protein U1Q18_044632 [Sarracenia purpurea var. burkii]
MEAAMEAEYDLFFADLNKQISLLIMDDDDPLAHCSSVSHQAFSRAIHPAATQSSLPYKKTCRRESKGTGVFIPQSWQYNSRPKKFWPQGRRSFGGGGSATTKLHCPSDNNSRGFPFTSYTTNNNPSHNSFSSKRC